MNNNLGYTTIINYPKSTILHQLSIINHPKSKIKNQSTKIIQSLPTSVPDQNVCQDHPQAIR
ncbi:MAG TPA: hypothetical protein PLC27_08835, partial [Saprospiraceae bacterium]|nr:hypothetical protein [Saprospiraceae bacterium]